MKLLGMVRCHYAPHSASRRPDVGPLESEAEVTMVCNPIVSDFREVPLVF